MSTPALPELDAALRRLRAAEREMQDARAALNVAVVLTHRKDKVSYTEIGKRLGITRQRVAQIVKDG